MFETKNNELFRKLCSEIYDETGKTAHVVDATWKLPTWNGLLNGSSIIKQGRPSCYFQPHGSDDVAAACRVAARHGLKMSARGSGHHYGGASLVEGSLLLDLSAMRSLYVDPASRIARVGPAVTGRQLRSALAPHGLHFPLPHLSDVGLSGYLLGGGNGWGVRQWGAAADNVEEIEVVLLAGGTRGSPEDGSGAGGSNRCSNSSTDDTQTSCQLVRIRSENDPELFWGLRGGGSFLGVATEFILRLHPVSPLLPLITATYPLTLLSEVANFFREFHCNNPTCVEATLAIVGAADSSKGSGDASLDASPAVVLVSCHAFAEPGSDEVKTSYAKLRALLPEARLSLQEGPVPYVEALSVLDPSWNWPGLCMYGHGVFVPVAALCSGTVEGKGAVGPDVGTGITSTTTTIANTTGGGSGDSGVVAALAAAASSITSRRSILLVCPSAPIRPGCTAATATAIATATTSTSIPNGGGGTCSTGGVAVIPGSLGFRGTFYLGIYGMWTRSEAGADADGDAAHVAWVRSCAAALQPYTMGLYVNEVMHDEASQVQHSYEESSYVRLQALKRRVDPLGLLRSL